jgi:hypothetical protein
MKFLMVHNDYGAPSGEEIQFYLIKDILELNGHEVRVYSRSSAEIPAMMLGKLRAFCAGIYNPFSRKRVAALIDEFRPDAVLIKNLFPFISPAILPVCRRMGVPVIMFVANYRLMCPNGLHMNKGRTCEKCLGGREYNCVVNNCEGSLFKSTGYALRSGVARLAGFYRKNVTAYVCASRFLRQRMIDAGFDAHRLHLIPNVVPEQPTVDESNAAFAGYVGYVGRISRGEWCTSFWGRAARALGQVQARGRVAGGEIMSARAGHRHAGLVQIICMPDCEYFTSIIARAARDLSRVACRFSVLYVHTLVLFVDLRAPPRETLCVDSRYSSLVCRRPRESHSRQPGECSGSTCSSRAR